MLSFGFFEILLSFILVLTPIVFIHELGHFWVARKTGVVVDVFSIGFGKEIFGWTDSHGTRWRFAWIPLGGYVKMRGDENIASGGSGNSQIIEGSFANAPLLSRIAIVSAGPIANFVLAFILFFILYVGAGKLFIPPIIGEVLPNSVAERSGLKSNDVVLKIDQKKVSDFNDFRVFVFESPGKPIELEIDRSGTILEITATPKSIYLEELDIYAGQLGIRSPVGEFRKLGILEAMSESSRECWSITVGMIRGISRIISGDAQMGEIGGPIRIAQFSRDAALQGLTSLVFFVALISINLGLVNLMPIPALDGGHLVFFIIEGIIGKPLPDSWQNFLLRGGIAFLLSLMLFVTIYDILRGINN